MALPPENGLLIGRGRRAVIRSLVRDDNWRVRLLQTVSWLQQAGQKAPSPAIAALFSEG
jgi:hypothetical protein